ncbi:MAG: thioredoxin family protein, partial [Gammaproteobacteria bacterium]
TTAGTLLPKAGPWMDGIKAAFGIMLLGVAIWMLEHIVPGPVALAMWAALVFLSGVAMGALVPLGETATGWRRFSKGLGLLFMAYAIMMLVGAASGSRDPFQPLTATVSGSATVPAAQLEFERIKSVSDLEISVKRANLAGKSVMLDFYADWCVSCKEMEKYTFTDPRVADTLTDTVLLQADVTANDDTDQALLKHMGIYGPPTIAFFGLDGLERKAYRVVGFMPAENFHLHASEAFMAPAE